MSKAATIRAMVKDNPSMTAKQIADKLGVRPQYVHGIIYLMRHNTPKRKVAKTPAVKTENVKAASDVKVVIPYAPDSWSNISLQAKLDEANTIIRYLARQLYGSAI